MVDNRRYVLKVFRGLNLFFRGFSNICYYGNIIYKG